MSAAGDSVELSRCAACETRYLPTDGPCPHCGSTKTESYRTPAIGTVLAATELANPASGWTSPHRLALVELADAVRVLAILEDGPAVVGTVVAVHRDGEVYRARTQPTTPTVAERGEGESPRLGAADPSFEPPR
jgi:uncharacterized OB-fold protein